MPHDRKIKSCRQKLEDFVVVFPSTLYNRDMNQRSYALLVALVAVVVLLTPLFHIAQVNAQQFPGDTAPDGIVSCGDYGEPTCGACDLGQLAQDALNFAVYFTVFVATLMFVYAGFLYITAGGDSSKISQATGIFGKVLIGFIIVLIAWLVVDTIMGALFNSDKKFGPWNQICPGFVNTGNNPGNPNAPGYLTYTQPNVDTRNINTGNNPGNPNAPGYLISTRPINPYSLQFQNKDGTYESIPFGILSECKKKEEEILKNKLQELTYTCEGVYVDEYVPKSPLPVVVFRQPEVEFGRTGVEEDEYSHEDGYSKFTKANVHVTSSADGKCLGSTCPSLDGIKKDTAVGVILLKEACGISAGRNNACSLNIIGGTEQNQAKEATEKHSHKNGYRLDFSINGSRFFTGYLGGIIDANKKAEKKNPNMFVLKDSATGETYQYTVLKDEGKGSRKSGRWDITIKREKGVFEKMGDYFKNFLN